MQKSTYLKTLEALIQLKTTDLAINVVVGASNPHKDSLKLICDINNFNYLCQVSNMAQLMAEADLAIGAGGTTTWERCYLQLPSVVISVAENQTICCKECSKLGIIKYLGISKNIDKELILTELGKIMSDRGLYNILYEKVKAQEISTGIEEVLGFIIEKER